jgi:hypothetical protein
MSEPPRGRVHPFCLATYEICDEDFKATGEVVIWSRSPLPPKLGELLNIDTTGALHELAVGEVSTFKGGWMATCWAEKP